MIVAVAVSSLLSSAGALEQVPVGVGAEHESMADRNVSGEVVVLRVDEQRRRTGVFDDVGDLVAIESEIDGDEHASVGGDAEECDQEPTGVRGQDRNSFAGGEAEIVERDGEGPSPAREFRVRDGSEPVAGWVRFVGHARSRAIDVLGSVQKVECGQRHVHRMRPPGCECRSVCEREAPVNRASGAPASHHGWDEPATDGGQPTAVGSRSTIDAYTAAGPRRNG